MHTLQHSRVVHTYFSIPAASVYLDLALQANPNPVEYGGKGGVLRQVGHHPSSFINSAGSR